MLAKTCAIAVIALAGVGEFLAANRFYLYAVMPGVPREFFSHERAWASCATIPAPCHARCEIHSSAILI
jgi:hypothetical protein